MEHFYFSRRAVSTKPEQPAPARRCVQCGEQLDAKRIGQLATRTENMMCSDCAFDAIPCTD